MDGKADSPPHRQHDVCATNWPSCENWLPPRCVFGCEHASGSIDRYNQAYSTVAMAVVEDSVVSY